MGSWKIGRAFGIGIYIHWTFLLLLGFVAFQGWGGEGGSGPLHTAALLILLFTCVVLHELGHALMARRFGVGTRDITLYPIGGVARLERMPENPWEELCIAVAGPAVNVVIVALLLIPLFLMMGVGASGDLLQVGRGNLLVDIILGNVVLVLFNILPAFPMDGGRVLRALLIKPFGRLQATRIATTVGAGFAFLFALVAILNTNPILMVLGFFVFMAGQQELAFVRFQANRNKRSAMPLLPLTPEILDVEPVAVQHAFNGAVWDQNHRVWVLWQDGRPVRTFWMPGSQG
jgi:Zn-dependent protease